MTGLTKRTRHDRPLTLADAPRWSASMAEHAELSPPRTRGDAERAGGLILEHLRRTGEAMAVAADPQE